MRATDTGSTSRGVQVFEGVEHLPACTTPLFDMGAEQSFFLSREWFRTLASNVPTQRREVKVFVLEPNTEDDLPGVLLPMWLPSPRRLSTIRSMRSLSNFYSGLFSPLTDFANPNAKRSVSHLVTAAFPTSVSCDAVNLSPLAPETSIYRALREGFRRAGWATQDYFCFGNWHVPVEGLDFDQYLASRPPALRNTLHRKRRRFLAEPEARIEISSGPDGLEAALDAYQTVYARSWKRPESFPRFVPDLARACSERGWLRLGLARLGDRPIAAQLWIVARGVAYIYKLAYDPRFRELSPGTLLTAALMEHVLSADRVHEVDFLAGDEPYKKDWMTQRRERWGILAFNTRRPMGALLALRHIAGRALKRSLTRSESGPAPTRRSPPTGPAPRALCAIPIDCRASA